MSWIAERKSLEVLKAAPASNGSLKKKLGIINRLKNLQNEAYPQLVADIKSENLQKFRTEIINSLLLNAKMQTNEDIHRVVRIVYLYSYDPAFLASMLAAAKKRLRDSWAIGAIYAEVYFLRSGQIDDVAKTLLGTYSDNDLPLIHYLVACFDGLDPSAMKTIRHRIQKSIESVDEKNIEVLGAICALLGISTKLEVPDNFLEVIKPAADEFAFYQAESRGADAPGGGAREGTDSDGPSSDAGGRRQAAAEESGPDEHPVFSPACLRRLGEEARNIEYLDFVSLHVSGSPDLVGKILKKRRDVSLVPAIARIVSRLSRGKRAVVGQLLAEGPDGLQHNDLVLVGELYKFGAVRPAELASLLNYFLKNRMVEKLAVLLENTGRYMLVDRKTNEYARDLLERLKALGATEIDRLFIRDCLSKIYQTETPGADILNFMQWLFKERTFSFAGVFQSISRSRKLLLVLFMQPELFESDEFLVGIIVSAGMEGTMLRLYLDSVEILGSKQGAFRIAEILAVLVGALAVQEQTRVLDAVLAMGLAPSMRYRMGLVLLDRCCPSVHRRYLDVFGGSSVFAAIRADLFNFCEKHGHELAAAEDLDSFERDMECLR